MQTSGLYRIDLSSFDDVEHFANILRPHIPHSLIILGSLFSSSDNLASAGTISPSLFAWISFEDLKNPPELFSAITYLPSNDHQFRFFCSAESRTGSANFEERRHVSNVIKTFTHSIISGQEPMQGVDSRNVVKTLQHDSRPLLHFGSVSDKWLHCLQPRCSLVIPCLKVLRVPSPARPPQLTGPWEITPIREGDIDFIRSRTVFPRSYEFIRSRLPWSICVRPKGGQGPPIAWQFLLPDGSFGMLHTESGYRRLNLARTCIAASCHRLEKLYATEDESKRGKYPHERWAWADILLDNTPCIEMTASMDDWGLDHGWVCHWMYITSEDRAASGQTAPRPRL